MSTPAPMPPRTDLDARLDRIERLIMLTNGTSSESPAVREEVLRQMIEARASLGLSY